MSTAAQRNEKINKLFKVARKYYQPILPPTNRTVIEHMLYSCCLENAPYDLADEVFAKLQEEYFDWNEVRVTTTAELAEVMKRLPDAEEAANRVRRSLHGLFEAHYTFDLEFLKKENLGKAIEQLSKYRGMSPFCVSYAAQVSLGGHSIPIDDSLIELAKAIDIVSDDDAANKKVTGLERTIPKNKGIEFSSVVHQLAVAFRMGPFNKDIRNIILEIDPDSQERFPRRGGRKKSDEVVEEPTPQASEPAAPQKGKAAAKGAAARNDKGQEKGSNKATDKAEDKASAKTKGKSDVKTTATAKGKNEAKAAGKKTPENKGEPAKKPKKETKNNVKPAPKAAAKPSPKKVEKKTVAKKVDPKKAIRRKPR
jgi:endonuclease-3